MRLAAFLAVMAAGALGAPWVLDAWDSDRAFAELAHRDARRRARLAAVSTQDPAASVARERTALARELGLGKPLPGVLVSLSDLAARCTVEVAVLAVQPPTAVPRDPLPGPTLCEYRARFAITGPEANVHRFVKLLPDLEGPFRIEAARLDRPPAAEGAEETAHLELALRVVVEG